MYAMIQNVTKTAMNVLTLCESGNHVAVYRNYHFITAETGNTVREKTDTEVSGVCPLFLNRN